MSTSISRSILWCSVYACLAAMSGCSDNEGANVSFQDIDRSEIPTDVVPNSDLSASNTEWTGWNADVDVTEGSEAEFELAPAVSQGGNSLKTDVINIEADSAVEDIQAGPAAVPVEAGQAYGVAAFVKGPTCGLGTFVVHAAGDPSTVLAEEEFFFTGAPQSFNYYFQVPDTGVTSVDLPVQLGVADNIGGEILLDRIIAISTVMPPAQAEGNVARNSDFEESDTDINVPLNGAASWANFGPATFTLDTTEAQSGDNSVRIDFEAAGAGNPWDIEAGPVNVAVVDGWTYTFSAWIKGDEGARANFLIQHPTAYNVYNEQAVTVTSEWQEVRFEATITGTQPNGVVRLYAQYNFPENANKTIYIDNIKLIPPDTCPYAPVVPHMVSENADLFEYNHVINGGLEESAEEHSGWSTQVGGAAAAEFAVQTVTSANRSLIYSDSRSLKTTITTVGANAWDIQAGPADLFVVPGQTYIYSGFARGAPGTRANFAAALQASPFTVFEEHLVTFNNIWQQVTFDFSVPENTPVLTEEELAAAGLPSDAVVARIRMAVNMSYPENADKRFFLDDFTLLPNAVGNGDLENSSSNAEGWSWQAADESATFALDSTQAHTGENSLKVTVGELADDVALWDVQAGIADIAVAGERKYFISTRIKGDAGTRAKILVDSAEAPYEEYASVGGEDGNDDDTRADGIALTEDWQEVTFEVDVPKDVTAIRLMAQLGFAENADSAIYLDSFRVVSQIPPPPKADTANLVTNGGLENGKVDGWNANNAQIAVVNAAGVPAGVYAGNFGLHVTDRTANWNSAQYNLMNAELEEGSTYLASAWVKVDGATADNLKLTLQISYDSGDPDYIGIGSTGAADTLNWTNLSGIFTFAPDATRTVTDAKVYIEADGANTAYYIDELFVTKVFTPNGNLESGNTTGWNAAGSQIAVSAAQAHSGSNALHVTGRTANWNSAQYNLFNSGMEPGRTYQVSAWVKIDGATPDNVKMTIEVVDENNDSEQGGNRYMTIAQSSATADWVKLSNTFTYAPDGEATDFKVYFEADGATSAYFIDDLVITEVIPPPNLVTNGGLEFGRTDGWNANNATIAVTRDSQGIHANNFGLLVSGRTANWNSAQFNLLEAGLVDGASYQASAWVKAAGDTADNIKLTLQITYDSGDPAYIGIAASGAADTLSWTKLDGIVNYVPDATRTVTDVKVYIEADGATTSYYVDDLVITRMFTPNGDLESGATTGWNAAGSQIAVTTDEAFAGTQSLHVSGRTANWNSAQYNLLTSGMEAGKTYDISAWVKIEGGTADNIKMTVELVDEDDATEQYMTIARSADTLTWVKLSSRYTYAPGGEATTFKVYFEADGATSSYYIDNLVITEASETY